MKLNNLEITRYNTGFRVTLVAWAKVKSQFTPALVQGEGHHLSLARALWMAVQNWRQEAVDLNDR